MSTSIFGVFRETDVAPAIIEIPERTLMNKKVPGTLNQLRKEYPVLLGSGPAERACTDVNAGAFVHGRMSLELAAELTQSLQILHRDEAGQRQSRVLNSGCQSPASSGGESVTNLTQWREISPH